MCEIGQWGPLSANPSVERCSRQVPVSQAKRPCPAEADISAHGELRDLPGAVELRECAVGDQPEVGVVRLKRSLAPQGAMVKVAGMSNLKFRGPGPCVDSEEACFDTISRRDYRAVQ